MKGSVNEFYQINNWFQLKFVEVAAKFLKICLTTES